MKALSILSLILPFVVSVTVKYRPPSGSTPWHKEEFTFPYELLHK